MNKNINSPDFNDNREYNYSDCKEETRLEYSLISDLIPQNSKVIDLGCGNGSLMKILELKNCKITGVEISESGVRICRSKGLNVIQGRIDIPLEFGENEFDYSVCNVTIQMVMYPEILLREMKRISKYQIISFPNFGFYKNRFELLLAGRMPTSMLFGYKWFSTGHIHQLSIKDFYELLDSVKGIQIKEMKFIRTNNSLKNFAMNNFPNSFLILPVFLLEKL
ncbi:MAG: methyltransferase domain-containing protein [Chloroflexi bacterium]|jgi:methionine biosynthesis protein MetW|nr:methyltransferase domain-containing protein [Chloroflexota bacterium]